MKPEVYWYTLLGSLAGAVAGALVALNRRGGAGMPTSPRRRMFVLLGGTGAIGCAVFAFGRAFGAGSAIHGPLVVILVTAWISVVGSVIRLPAPARLLRASRGETAWLSSPWSGVPSFGVLLRRTPLKRLGGPVHLSATDGDPGAALEGMIAAEKLHLWALIGSMPWLLNWGFGGRWLALTCALLTHLPLNVLPVLHLRLAIRRTERCRGRLERYRERRRPGRGRSAAD